MIVLSPPSPPLTLASLVHSFTQAPTKPDGYHTICLKHTFPSGLIVSNCTDGSVKMETVTCGKASVFGDDVANEVSRTVQGKGTVVRFMRDGSRQILYMDGSQAVRPAADSSEEQFTVTSVADGKMYKKQQDPFTNELVYAVVGSCERRVETDPETKDKVITIVHSGGKRTRRVEKGDGTIMVVHSDGTVVRSATLIEDEDGVLFCPKILVEAKGMASVEFDVEVDQQARGYAEGKQIAISKGGDMIRSRTAFPDGSYALTTFDTRITSPLCGRIIAVRPDRTEIVASDDGMVVHRVRKLWKGVDSYECERNRKKRPPVDTTSKKKMTIKDDPDAQPDPDMEGECYCFDLVEAKMSTSDKEHNLFQAWLGAVSKSGTVNVELAGVLGPIDINDGMRKVPAVVNEPIEPRMFVIARDGSGFEILSQNDIEDWERRVQNEAETLRDVTKGEEGGCIRRFSDPSDLASSEREFEAKYRHVGKEVWTDQSGMEIHLHDYACLYAKTFGVSWNTVGVVEPWHVSSLPACARYSKKAGKEGCDGVVGYEESPTGNVLDRAPEILITRRWVEIEPLATDDKKKLTDAIEECEQWRMARQNTIDRFSVDDDRDITMIKAEENMAKILKRAYKVAKANRKREKERERATMIKNRNAQEAKEQAAAGHSQIPGMGGLQRIESAGVLEEEEEEDEWDSDEDEGGRVEELEEDSAEYKEVHEVWEVVLQGERDGGDSDEDGEDFVLKGDEKMGVDGCRAAVVQLLGSGFGRAEMEGYMEGMAEVAFADFYRMMNRVRSDRERNNAMGGAEGVEGEEKKEEQGAGENQAENGELVMFNSHGGFFRTADGAALREKSIKDKTYYPKKKGDIRWLSTEEIPKPNIRIRPKTVGEVAVGGEWGELFDNSVYEESSEVMKATRAGTAPAAIGRPGGTGPLNGGSVSPSAGMSINELRDMAATGSGRNAVRAKALVDKEDGKRLREGERPADIDIHGMERGKPVRMVDRALGKTNVGYVKVEENAYKGRNTPDVSIRSLSPNPERVGVRVGESMEVIPEVVNFGFVKVGSKCGAQLNVGNLGLEAVRYSVIVEGGGGGDDYTVTVSELPRGAVAAGIRVAVEIEVTCKRCCEIDGVLRIKSEREEVGIQLMGNIVSSEELRVVSGKSKRSKQVWCQE